MADGGGLHEDRSAALHKALVEDHFNQKVDELAENIGVEAAHLYANAAARRRFAEWTRRFAPTHGRAAEAARSMGTLREAVEVGRVAERMTCTKLGWVAGKERDLHDEHRRSNLHKLRAYCAQHGQPHDGRPLGVRPAVSESSRDGSPGDGGRGVLQRGVGTERTSAHHAMTEYRRTSAEVGDRLREVERVMASAAEAQAQARPAAKAHGYGGCAARLRG